MSSELEVVHETRYDYAAPVSLAHHLAHLQPLHDAHQRLLAFELEIDPPPATQPRRHRCDGQCRAPLQPGPAAPGADGAGPQPRAA